MFTAIDSECEHMQNKRKDTTRKNREYGMAVAGEPICVDVAFTHRTHMKLIRIGFRCTIIVWCNKCKMQRANDPFSYANSRHNKRLHLIPSTIQQKQFIFVSFKSAAISNNHQNH